MKSDGEIFKAKIFSELNKLIKTNKLKNKRIVMFAASENTTIAINFLKAHGVETDFIIDNDKKLENHKWLGFKVYNVDYLKKCEGDFFVIMVGSLIDEKIRQLKFIGLKQNVHFYIIRPDDKSLIHRFSEIFIAYFIYLRIKNKYKKDKLFLCPYPGTGDAYLTAMYLESFIKENNIDNYLILTRGKAFEKILKIFGITNSIVISEYAVNRLKDLYAVCGEKNLSLYYMLYWGLSTQGLYRIETHNNFNFHNLFRTAVFKYRDDSCRAFPNVCSEDVVSKFIEDNKLKENKTVVIAPYANSFSNELSADWWEELVYKLKEKGFYVYTNSIGENEPVIKGTKGINFPFDIAVRLLERLGCIISVRSGFCDCISSAKCKKIIIYQDFLRKERMDFFSLNNMGLCDDAKEFKLQIGKKKELMENILNEILI